MNEKIEELAEQAGLYDFVVDAMGIDEEMQKFAELIIRTCMDMVIAHDDDAPEEFHKLWLHIKEHFGIE